MASGTIDLGTSGYLQGRITWSSTSNGTAKNSSQVTGTLQARRTNSYTTTGTWTGSLKLGSTSKSYSKYAAITSSWVTLCSFTITQAHNTNGNGTCSIYGQIKGPTGTSMEGKTLSKTQSVTLDTIPRQATITAAPNFNDEGNPTITYSNPAGNSVTSLEACISLTGATDDIKYRAISKTGTSYTFNLTDSERKVLQNATTTSKTRTVKFFVRTVISGTTFHSNLTKTLSIVNANPTLSPTIEDIGTRSTVLTDDSKNKIIKYFNEVQVATGAKALKGATIKSQSITCGNKKITTASGILSSVETATFVFSVTDSRGNTTTQTVTNPPILINYVKPTCNLEVPAPSTDGDLRFTISGNCFNGSFGAVNNSITVEYQWRVNNEDYSDWIPVDYAFNGNSYTAVVELTDLNYLNKYTFRARVKDSIEEFSVTTSERVVKTRPVFDWGPDDFNVNGTLSVNGIKYNGDNNVLWSGGYYMTADHKAKLSQKISEQPHGIVLVFSRYTEDGTAPYAWHSFFVPKYAVVGYNTSGHTFIMSTNSFSAVATKYLYIRDSEIAGNENNNASGTSNGITYNNAAFVLRYVIGV